jgi:hypothetical protein
MSKHEFTTNNDTIQMALFPEVPEEKCEESSKLKNKSHHSPTFIPMITVKFNLSLTLKLLYQKIILHVLLMK